MSTRRQRTQQQQQSLSPKKKRSKGQSTLASIWETKTPSPPASEDSDDDTPPRTTDNDVNMTETPPILHSDHSSQPSDKPPAASTVSPPKTPAPASTHTNPNARARPASSASTQRSSTPPRSNRRPAQDFRYEFRLTIPASPPDDAFQAVTDTLAKILTKIWESDSNAKILPWYANSNLLPLKSSADIPTNLSTLRQYFPRLTPNARGGTRFSNIHIRSVVPPATLKADIDWYLRDNNHGLYLAQIQAETVDPILWLLWSSELTDTAVLRHAIEQKLLQSTGKQIQVGLRWRIIQLDRAGRIPDDEAVKAVHIEVDRNVRNEAKSALEDMYSATATDWPLHTRMRAVPLLRDVMNNQVKRDIHRLIGRQASFNDEDLGKRKINTWEIKELDFSSAALGKTLRDLIMDIPRMDDPSRKLFHSADHLRSNRSTVVLTCIPALEPEARSMVASLLTYLKHLHGDAVLEFFTKDAQLRAVDAYWDAAERCVRNNDDSHVSSLLDNMDDDYVLPPIVKRSSAEASQLAPARPEPPHPPTHSLQRNTFGDEEDSVTTFRRDQARDSATVSSSHSDSESTIASLTSRLSSLENLRRSHNITFPANSPPANIQSVGMAAAGDSPGDGVPGEDRV